MTLPVVVADGEPLPVLLTSMQVAKALQVSPSTLCRWRTTGYGPRVFWVTPDSPRYLAADVIGWLEEVGA
ncbi:MAG TPA: DNA-binding protein [Dermatophilaceae bacterium]|nr:DNA-binding protein [Dermatophilaceae bacterium]